MINVTTATTSELIAFFNEHSATPVKKFQDRATAERRVTAIIALLEAEASSVPEAGIDRAPTNEENAEPNDEGTFDLPPEDLSADQEPVEKPAEVKVNPDKVHIKAATLFAKLAGTPPAECFRQVLEAFPDITRIQFKHTAAAAGFKPLTARNAFDRIRGVK